MLEKCPNSHPSFLLVLTRSSFRWLFLGNLRFTSLEPPPPMLGWIHLLTGPPREKPGAGPGKVRGNRAGYIDLGSSRRKRNKEQSPERYSNSHQPHSKGIQHDSTEERESWHIVGAHELFREERDFVAMSSKNWLLTMWSSDLDITCRILEMQNLRL